MGKRYLHYRLIVPTADPLCGLSRLLGVIAYMVSIDRLVCQQIRRHLAVRLGLPIRVLQRPTPRRRRLHSREIAPRTSRRSGQAGETLDFHQQIYSRWQQGKKSATYKYGLECTSARLSTRGRCPQEFRLEDDEQWCRKCGQDWQRCRQWS